VLPTQLDFWTPPKSCTDVSWPEPPIYTKKPPPLQHFSDLLRVRNPRRSSFYLLSSHLFLKYDGLTVSLGGRPASRRHIALLAINFDPVSGGSVTVTGRISCRGVATGTKCVFFWFMTHWRTALALGLWALPRGEEVQKRWPAFYCESVTFTPRRF